MNLTAKYRGNWIEGRYVRVSWTYDHDGRNGCCALECIDNEDSRALAACVRLHRQLKALASSVADCGGSPYGVVGKHQRQIRNQFNYQAGRLTTRINALRKKLDLGNFKPFRTKVKPLPARCAKLFCVRDTPIIDWRLMRRLEDSKRRYSMRINSGSLVRAA